MWVVLIGWIVLSIVVLIVWMTMRSPWGRVLRAIREDEDAARSLGKSMLVQNAVAHYRRHVRRPRWHVPCDRHPVSPASKLITDVTFFTWVALILGGAAKVGGPIAGAAILYGILNFTDVLLDNSLRMAICQKPLWTASGRSSPVHDDRSRSHFVGDLPTSGNFRNQRGDGAR